MIILHRGERIEALLLEGLRLFRLNVLGRSILLKPNLVEEMPGSVNTNSALIGAAARGFFRLGATRVMIVEARTRARALLVMTATGSAPSAFARIECGIEGAEPASSRISSPGKVFKGFSDRFKRPRVGLAKSAHI